MATILNQPVNNNLQYSLNTKLVQGGTSAVLSSSVAGVVQAPGVMVIDRVDTAGNKTPTVREYITFTGVSTNTLSGLSRGLAGSSDQDHNVGALVEFVPDVTWANSVYNTFTQEHSVTGQHLSLASVTFINALNAVVQSQASIGQINVQKVFNTSGASLQAFPVNPVWIYSGTASGASANLGFPLTMPNPGTIQWVDVTTRIGSSGASLFLDITKNGAAILNGNASQSPLTIPINGTFASTASIASPIFKAGDVLNFSILNSGSMAQDLSVKLFAR